MPEFKVLVTGSFGFVGLETCKYLMENGINVVGFDIMQGDGSDVRDIQTIENAVIAHRVNRILHLAAIARFSEADKNPKIAYETNALGTRNIAAIASKYHIPIIYASTGSVYMPIKRKPPITEEFEVMGNSVYGCSKAVGECYVQESTSPWIILRYAHLYGPLKVGHGLVGGFVERISRGMAPVLYGGKQGNDFCHVSDVADANLRALTAPWSSWNQAYNIGTGEMLTAEEAGKIVCKAFGWNGKIEVKQGRSVDPEIFVYDTKKAEKMLQFKAKVNFHDGVFAMVQEMRYNIRDGLQRQGEIKNISKELPEEIPPKKPRESKKVE